MVIVSVPLTRGLDKSMTVNTILPAGKFLMALPEPRFLPVARDIQLYINGPFPPDVTNT